MQQHVECDAQFCRVVALHEAEIGGKLAAAFYGERVLAWIIFDEKHVRYFNVFFALFISWKGDGEPRSTYSGRERH
jgi:hypothetical protein